MRILLRPHLLRGAGALALAALLIAGCGTERPPEQHASGSGSGGAAAAVTVTAIYALPASLDELAQETWFDHPWPSDLRLENGSPRFAGFYNPRGFAIIDTYVEAATGLLDGFSPAASGFLRFTGPIDPASLPATPGDALDPAASVQLVDVDPASPEHGQRKLVSVRWQEADGVYYRSSTLAFMPTIGFPLRPRTRYALVVTSALRAKSGDAVTQQIDLAKVVGVEAPDAGSLAAHTALGPAVAELAAAGIPGDRIVHLAVFTTADPTVELTTVRDAVADLVPAPAPEDDQWALNDTDPAWQEYLGRYGPSPNFQAGTLPFTEYGDGGGFVFQDGKPVLQDTFDLRFSLVVPDAGPCPMPAAGYPVVLFAHGTGGHWRTYIKYETGQTLAKRCIATMGVDQIFHGDRPGAPATEDDSASSILFYNFQNVIAARTNGRQSTIDEVQRARLFTETHMTVPANVSSTGSEILFDASKLLVFGHSQGGLNGALFTAIDPSARGGVFSGAGAEVAIALLEKTEPAPSPAALVRTLLGLGTDEGNELDVFHPVISMAQSLLDVVDPLHYGRFQVIEPRAGAAPKSIYMGEGVNPDGTGDTRAPPHGIEAHALCIGLPLQLPARHDIVELAWGGPKPVNIPAGGLAGNLGGGKASGVLAQWAPSPGDNGHKVIFFSPEARAQSEQFLQNLAADAAGLVPPLE